MCVIALTGSIAMGKTTTARLFAEEGVPVHDADAAVHELYEGEAAGLIETAFPGATKDGKVDRVALGQQVVGNPPALQRLEAIVHPLVRQSETKFLHNAEGRGAPIVVLDIPLLFETGGDSRVDATVVVSAPAEMQRARALERTTGAGRARGALARRGGGWGRGWGGRCRGRKRGGGPISSWIAGKASTMPARRCGKFWR